MDIVHFRNWFPGFVPIDVINVIYYFLGIQTPSCKTIAAHIQKVSATLQIARGDRNKIASSKSYRGGSVTHYGFDDSIDTLWNGLFWWHFPQFLSKNGQEKTLTRAELDLSIAYHQLLQALCKNKIKNASDSQLMLDNILPWHQMRITDLQDRISERARMVCLEIDRVEKEALSSLTTHLV